MRWYCRNAWAHDSSRKRQSLGHPPFSEQIDVVVYDRQYSPFILQYQGQTIVPAESVYAAFEAKQSLDAIQVKYAQGKVKTVRALHRTSLPVPYAQGEYPPEPPQHIIGRLLTLDSAWKPALGNSLLEALNQSELEGRLDRGCAATHGTFWLGPDGHYCLTPGKTAATAFLLELIARLQACATVPMIDVRAYAKWLDK